MIRGTSENVIFVCDTCGKEAPGISVPTRGTGTFVVVEPDGWYKAVKQRGPGTVIRHYCEKCKQDDSPVGRKVLAFPAPKAPQ